MERDATERTALSTAWEAVAGDRPDPPVEVTGPRGLLPAALPVADVAVASVAAALRAAVSLADGPASEIGVDRAHVARAVVSERHFSVDGRAAGDGFAPLSRFWRTADGWVRTHANYPWHREALLGVLDVADGTPDLERTAEQKMSEQASDDLAQRVTDAGGLAVRVREADDWASSEPGRTVAEEPLVGHRVLGEAPARRPRSGVQGLRVLDLTRVIAGPVATRLLGALGADVLRLDPPHRPDLHPGRPSDTLLGKRSALLDLRTDTGTGRLDELLDGADVLVVGYRPGSLEQFGLDDDALAERHPGLVVVRLDAWGWSGPWSGRRGFDSLVQAAVGVAATEADRAADPGRLPCQLLDHATGYLAAAAALDAVRRQRTTGGTHVRRLSLARTAHWLLTAPRPGPSVPDTGPRLLADQQLASGEATLTAVRPPGRLGGAPLAWPEPAPVYLGSDPVWHAASPDVTT